MGQKSKPKSVGMPFRTELGPRLGSGQDNVVFDMVYPAEKPHLRVESGQVLKINHATVGEHRVRYADDRQAALSGLQYKKNKYDILKRFLGNFVPRTSFVLGEVTEGTRTRYAEYTVQDKVPRLSLSDLTEEQKQNPALKRQVVELMSRLRQMYQTIGEANARTSQGITLDGKLDLGGVSDYVRTESLDRGFDESDAEQVISANNSPNLLVDPQNMTLSCIDFDQGQWRPGMDEAKNLVFELADKHDATINAVGGTAIQLSFGQQELPFEPVQ